MREGGAKSRKFIIIALKFQRSNNRGSLEQVQRCIYYFEDVILFLLNILYIKINNSLLQEDCNIMNFTDFCYRVKSDSI